MGAVRNLTAAPRLLMPSRLRSLGGLALLVKVGSLAVSRAAATDDDLIRGVSYGPVPLKTQEGAAQLPQDDWMCDEAVTMWGRAGRGDLRVMKRLGANLVRLYGNNPHLSHANFLDTAYAEGLKVAPGMSDYPYYQQVPGRCLDTNFDCFDQVKPLYALNLQNGFLTEDKQYHPALKFMNILNEPDLKMPPTMTNGGPEGPLQMGRALVSAFDAMLDAEKDAGVTGPLINFTATFSYAICGSCGALAGKPALGQIWQLDDAMRNPAKYGYTPKNDVTAAYKARFTHSFNTQNPATDLQAQFLDDYTRFFSQTPVYIGEYHRVQANQTEDLSVILGLARENPLFLGISFFQYQVAYWKTGTEMDFGMFGLSDQLIAQMPYAGKSYDIYCLTEEAGPLSELTIPDSVAKVYGGVGEDEATLCGPNPWAVPLNQAGYEEIAALGSPSQTERFVKRVVESLGATIANGDATAFQMFARRFSSQSQGGFAEMATAIGGSRPSWASFDPLARCVSNRDVHPSVVVSAIDWTCANAKTFSCAAIPDVCKLTAYRTADFIFSRYYGELDANANPLIDCSFQGAAQYAASAVYLQWDGATECVEGAGDLQPVLPSTSREVMARQAALASTTAAPPSGSGSTSLRPQYMNMGGAPPCAPAWWLLPLLLVGSAGALELQHAVA